MTKKNYSSTNDTGGIIDFLNLFKVRTKYNLIYQNIALLGLLCLYLLYIHSNDLLIPFKDLSIVGFAADIIITLLFFKFYNAQFTILWALIHNLTIGFIVIYLFIWTNDNLSTKANIQEILPIENIDLQDNHQRRNRGMDPVITLTIKGRQQRIKYRQQAFKDVMNAREVKVTIKEGFWGYWVLTDIQLMSGV